MGILIHNTPSFYSLAGNDNAYVFRSTNFTPTQRFKVSVVPVDFPISPEIAVVRVSPRQGIDVNGVVTTDRAYYDPSRILQSLIGTDIAIPSVNHVGVFACPNTHTEYSLIVQEEDVVNGAYVGGASFTVSERSVWNGIRNEIDWLDFDYTDYDMTTPASGKKFLSDAPSTRYVDTGQSAFLHYLSSGNTIRRFYVRSYGSNGVEIDSGYMAAGPAVADDKYARIACGPYDIINSDPSSWTDFAPTTGLVGAAYYDVWMGNPTQEVIRFHIDQKCTRYTPIRLHWLNRLGGFDAFNFSLKSTESTKVTRDSYVSQPHTFSGSSWDYNKMSRGRTEYNIEMQEMLTINTDYLTGDESTWMEDLFTSPVIFQELNNELIAVNIDGRSIKKQTSLNDKLMQYTFDLEYSLRNKRQRG